MAYLVDSPIWSLAFRRTTSVSSAIIEELYKLIDQEQVHIIGAVRQEVLSGIRHQQQFERIREDLEQFPDLEVVSADYERAAEMFNQCRQKGIQGSNTDFLICAVSERYNLPIFTTDKDFQNFQTVISLRLHTFS